MEHAQDTERDHIEHDKLQAYFDRELGPGETTIVARHVKECAQCGKALRRLERLSALVVREAERASEDPSLEGLYARVQDGIAKQKRAGFGERLSVWTSEVLEHHRKPVVASLGLAIAAAAAAILVLQPFKGNDTHAPKTKIVRAGGTHVTPAPATPGTSSVLAYDFGDNAGTVFNVEDDSGGEYAVVWIDEAPSDDRGSH